MALQHQAVGRTSPAWATGATDTTVRALGRWVSQDPSNEGKCPNLYTAFSNQPTDRIDPDGRDDEPVTQPTTVPAFDEGESSGKGYLAWNETPESIWQRMAEGRLNACPTSLKLPAAVEEMLARAMACHGSFRVEGRSRWHPEL